MPKEIIVLNQVPGSGICFSYVLWAVVPLSRQAFYAKPGAVSAWLGASAAENAAIAAGQIAETQQTQGWATGTSVATIKAALIAAFNTWQTYVNGFNNWSEYGTFFDGTTWNQGGVA